MRFTEVGTKFVKKKVFKLDVDIFHQKQPNCKLNSYERAKKRKIQQFHPEIEDGIDLRRCPLLLLAQVHHLGRVLLVNIYERKLVSRLLRNATAQNKENTLLLGSLWDEQVDTPPPGC